jgi:WD40 repeat protein
MPVRRLYFLIENVDRKNTDELNIIRGVMTASMASGDIHRKCMEGTRISILEKIEQWRVDPMAPQILWLADVAGSGKSTVAKHMAEKWKAQVCLAGRFFFSRDAEETRTPKLLFTTVAQQGLAHLGPNVRSAVAAGISKLINPVSATLEEQCSNLFINVLRETNIPVVLVLDALDECDPETCCQLLSLLLSQLSTLPHLKLLMTSRPESHIQTELGGIVYQEISLRSNELANSEDVELFMKERLKKASLPDRRTTELIERAGGLFIWAKTVCDLIDKSRGNKSSLVDRILSQKLRQMDSIYRIALDQAIGKDSEEETMEAYMKVLGVVVAAYEPLSPKTLDQLLKSSETMDIINDLRSVLECAGENAVIRFLHPTFREFLLNKEASGRYYVDINTAHTHLARGCLSVMNEELQYDICKLYEEFEVIFEPEELNEKCFQHLSSALQYSCGFWVDHVPNDDISSVLTSIIGDFFVYKLLDWIYVVSIQGSINKAMMMLRKLILTEPVRISLFVGIILKEIQTENIGKWSNDVSRFLKRNWNQIRENPLRVYHIFAFCPRSSIFYQVYSKMESFPHPVVMMGLDEDWPTSIMVETYWISTHCLSPSEDILAIGGQRDKFAVYSVYDTKTGDGKTFVHPCKSHNCGVCHVSFDQSRSNVELLTGCECGTLCRWDISSHSHNLLEQMHLESTGLHWWWANDGSKAVYKIEVDKLEMDNDDKPSLLYRLSIPGTPPVFHILFESAEYTRWYFSPGHGNKVVGVDREKLALWECSSGRQIFQKSYKIDISDGYPHVCFSPDGTMIAFTGGGVVELISAEDGTVLRSWDRIRHLNRIRFFPKGDRFIGSGDKSSYSFGRSVYLFDGGVLHEKEINCMTISISPDGQRVALISFDGVDIFNHTLDEKLEKYDSDIFYPSGAHFLWIHSILISIKNYDISFHHLSHNAPPNLSTHESSHAHPLLLSPDNRHLLTLHYDHSIHVWDVKSGQRLHPPDNQIANFPFEPSIEHAPDSPCALVWDENQIMLLRYSANRIEWIPVISRSSSKLLAATFFQDSDRILIIDADGNVTTVSLRDMSPYSMPRLRSRFNKIRQLVTSPTEKLLAICNDSGLIIRETCQDTDRTPLLSSKVEGAVFSPEETDLYTLESAWSSHSLYIMISRVDTQNWTVQRISLHDFGSSLSRITLCMYNWGSNELDTMKADGLSALRISCDDRDDYNDIFLSLSTGRQIMPPSSFLIHVQVDWDELVYRDQWLMSLPKAYKWLMNRDHIAYIHRGKVLVLDYSSLIRHL